MDGRGALRGRRRRKRSRPDITVHYAELREDEVTEERGIPVTTPARTLLDLAPVLPSPVLARMIEAAPPSNLAEPIERYPRKAGVPEAMTAAGLPHPEVNVVIEGYEVDFVWREHRVIAELDTYVTHGSHAAFERERDRKLAIADWRVVRLTNEAGVADLSRLLAATEARSPRRRAAA